MRDSDRDLTCLPLEVRIMPRWVKVKRPTLVLLMVSVMALGSCSTGERIQSDDPGTSPSVTDTTADSSPVTKPSTVDQPADPEGLSTTVTRIVDGDTIDVAWRDERVRLIGIDTPEVYGGSECYGAEASRHAGELIPVGTEVRLELDVQERDRYGRLLAYVWRADDGLFVNEAMVSDGFAMVYTVPPSMKYVEVFVAAQQEAREADRGLWAACPPEPASTTAGTATDGDVAVTITNIHYDACGNDVECYNDSEYVELANTTGSVVDLSGWSVVDLKDHRIVIPSGFSIGGEGTFRIYSGAGDNNPVERYFAGLPQAIWNNSGGDTAFLYDAQGQLVAEHSYSS